MELSLLDAWQLVWNELSEVSLVRESIELCSPLLATVVNEVSGLLISGEV